MEYRLESGRLNDYLQESRYVDYHHPAIQQEAGLLFAGCTNDLEKILLAFTFVRDELPHSGDIHSSRVTRTASEALRFREGICYAKSMLLAALLLEKSLPEDEALAQRLSVPGKTRAAALRGALATTAAIVLHNLPEGILTLFTNAADSALGPSLALAIALHNIPEGIAVAVPVYYATHSRTKSLLFALGSGLAEPAGALAAFFLLRGFFSPLFLNGLLALVAGVMLQVSFAQLLAGGFSYGKNGSCAVGLAVGTLCMGVGLYLV